MGTAQGVSVSASAAAVPTAAAPHLAAPHPAGDHRLQVLARGRARRLRADARVAIARARARAQGGGVLEVGGHARLSAGGRQAPRQRTTGTR